MKIDKAAILIKKAALEFDRISNAVLEKYDLTAAQYKVMKYLLEQDECKVRIVDLEKYFSMSHPTAIGIVQNLEKKGLITYQENPSNARSRYIVPTEKAFDMEDELEELGNGLEAEFTGNLSEKERQRLVSLLCKMLDLTEEI